MAFHRRAASLALLGLGVSAACVEDVGFLPDDGKLALRVRLDEGAAQIERVGSRMQPEAPAPRTGPAIGYELVDETGRVVVAGRVADPRIQRLEVADEEGLHGEELFKEFGVFDLLLPGLRGELIVHEETREGRRELGRAAVDPSAPASHSSALMTDRDVGTLRTLVDHGDAASSLDLLFLPEGYGANEQGAFEDAVRAVSEQLERDPDYGAHWDRINILVQDVTSRDSGLQEPGGRELDTAFEMILERFPGRTVYYGTFTNPQGREAAMRLGHDARADKVIVVLNSSVGGGSGGEIVTLFGGSTPDTTLAHELGHSLLGLDDEYETSSNECGERGSGQPGPNISMTPDWSRLPWRDLVEGATPLPTPERVDEVGAYRGGWYCDAAYRPQHSCLMRTLGTPMCEVCRRELDAYFARLGPGGGSRGGAEPRDGDVRNEGGGVEDRVTAGWSCAPGYQGTDDGCDCGCGATDPDCRGESCTEAGCRVQGCEFCHGDGSTLACNDVAGRDEPADLDAERQDDQNAEGCTDYDWSSRCVDGDDYCDEGDGCCAYDLDDQDGGPCREESDAADQDECADYDYDNFCVNGDTHCDVGDDQGCCWQDSDCGEDEDQRTGGACDDYDWTRFCLDGDGFCDEGDGCCSYDWDNATGSCRA